MCAILAPGGNTGSSVNMTPCDCKKPHLALSSIAFIANATRLSKSFHVVATIAILCESALLKSDALKSSLERRLPQGSSSKDGPSNEIASSLAASPPILFAETNNSPPSIDFNSS